MRAHGDRNRYMRGPDENDQPGKGCRCIPCGDDWRLYRQERARLMAYGRWQPYVDAEQLRGHVTGLVDHGLSPYTIASMSGVDRDSVAALLSGAQRGLQTANADALLALRFDLDLIPGRSFIDAAGTRRRVQALAMIGHSVKSQAIALGRVANNFNDVVTQAQVLAYTARQVRDLYDEWSMSPPPASHGAKVAQTLAVRKGWLPPFAWDDDLIDLTDDALKVKLGELAEAMTEQELNRCHAAYAVDGDKSPLTKAGEREYKRRYARRQVAA